MTAQCFCKTAVVISLGLLSAGISAAAKERIPLRIGKDTLAFHAPLELQGKTIYGRSPDEHFIYMVEDALEALGREKDILVLSVAKFKNGLALMSKGHSGVLVRIIAVDEDELERFGKPTKTALARTNISISLLSLAHEIGHHVCGHLAGGEAPLWEQELEADHVAGAILVTSPWRSFYGASGNKELSLDDFLDAGRKVLGSETGSQTHPPLAARLDAIRAGWKGEPICKKASPRP